MLRLLALVFLSFTTLAQAMDYVWWEGETPKSTDFPAKHPFEAYSPQEKDALSEGKWLGIGGADGNAGKFAEYDVTVPKDGEYDFYVRKFWKHGPFKWRFGSQEWQQVGSDPALLDGVDIRKFVGVNWIKAGRVKLAAGAQTFRLELTDPKAGACFDCFLLINGAFTARGKMKPGQKYNRAPEGWFPFEPDDDTFAPTPLDLRGLNEKFAGENGFIKVKGNEFIHEKNGQPVRFWAINGGTHAGPEAAAEMARYLAKLGVNLVRLHGAIYDDKDLSADPKKIDYIHQMVAAYKKEGIYTSLSIYFPVWMTLKPHHGFEGYNSKQSFAMPYWNERFQGILKSWHKTLLTTKNPYTGLALNEDPAVAFTEITNEDGLMFWTFNDKNVPDPELKKFEKMFGDWLKQRYGSLDAAFTKWGNSKTPRDNAAEGRAGFLPLWNIANQRNQRAQETAEFLTVTQTKFYESQYQYIRNECGFKGSVYGSNWVTADARFLGPLDKYSNTVCDFMDRHGYYGGPHKGDRAGYSINKGDTYDDACALLFDGDDKKKGPQFSLPIFDLAYNGKPSVITEINWTPPNRFRADLPLLAAAYGSLQGTDAFYFFAHGDPGWDQGLKKFGIATPACMGQFPAAALLYRKGLVKTGDVVVRAEVKLADLYALKGAPLSAPQNLDEFRKKDIPAGQALETAAVSSIDPLSYLCGRVEINVTKDGGTSKVVELSKLIDREKKTVRSGTGELSWDYANGLVTIDAPQAQGATGFLSKSGAIQLGDLTIQSGIEYGAVALVALDGQPLKTSSKMLLQVMSEDVNFGWQAPGSGLRAIVELGGPPLVIKKLNGVVSLKRSDAESLKVTALDFNGYKSGDAGNAKAITLQEKTLYYVIEK